MTELDTGRVVQLYNAAKNEFSSGYVVRPGVVVTSAHSVQGGGQIAVVGFRADHSTWKTTASGVPLCSDAADLAILLCTTPPEIAADGAEFAQVKLGENKMGCAGAGFPRFMLRETSDKSSSRDSHTIYGWISGDGARTGDLTIVTELNPPEPDPKACPWGGISGTVVFADGRVIGLVKDHHHQQGPQLTLSTVKAWYDRLTVSELTLAAALLGLPTSVDGLHVRRPPKTEHQDRPTPIEDTLLDEAQPQRTRPAQGTEPALQGAAPTETDDASPLAMSLRVLAQAVRNQWHEEIRARGLYRPAPLPVPLVVTSGPLTGETRTVTTSAELLSALPSRRLVITGPRGSGKTTCAMLLAESLLKDSHPGTPVPVLLSLSSWDPEAEELRSWVAHRITEDYPGALTDIVSARQLARGRHLLPVLDGLEEIAESKRSLALRRIGEAYDSRDPLVLTCTDSEFKAAVREGGSLTSASVVAMRPAPLEDVMNYLRPEDGESPWDTVLPALAMRPGMRRVVDSPLLVALLRTHYELPGRNPEELLEESEFPNARAVEHRLLDDLVMTAFTQRPAGTWRPRQPLYPWPLPLAERYLSQLAQRTHSDQLKWWQQFESLLGKLPYQILLGFVAGALWFVAAIAMAWPMQEHGVDLLSLMYLALLAVLVGLAFGVSIAGSPATPSQMWQGIEHAPGRLRRARKLVAVFGRHMAIGLLLTGCMIAFSWVFIQLFNGNMPTVEECRQKALDRGSDTCLVPIIDLAPQGRSSSPPLEVKPEDIPDLIGDWREFAEKIPLLIVVSLVAAFVVFVYGLLASGPASDAFPTPRSSLSGARRRALGTTILQVLGLVVAGAVLYSFFRLPWASLGFGTLLITTVVLWTLSRSSWGRYHVAHWVLARRGDVPWRLMAFCEDAHRLNVLRQAGSAYEFRHGVLRDRLAQKPSPLALKGGRPAPAEATTAPELPRLWRAAD